MTEHLVLPMKCNTFYVRRLCPQVIYTHVYVLQKLYWMWTLSTIWTMIEALVRNVWPYATQPFRVRSCSPKSLFLGTYQHVNWIDFYTTFTSRSQRFVVVECFTCVHVPPQYKLETIMVKGKSWVNISKNLPLQLTYCHAEFICLFCCILSYYCS